MRGNYYGRLVGKEVVKVERLMDVDGEFQNPKRMLAKTNLLGHHVSTVFLVINHGWHDEDLWFETMIFGPSFDQEMWRYGTYDEAMTGHMKAVRMVRRAWWRLLWPAFKQWARRRWNGIKEEGRTVAKNKTREPDVLGVGGREDQPGVRQVVENSEGKES
jgi:hypothetical protein